MTSAPETGPGSTDAGPVAVSAEGGVTTVRIARPEAMNALADYRLQHPREEVTHVLTQAYPAPNKPQVDPLVSKDLNDLRLRKWESEARLIAMLSPGQALWRVASRSFVVQHHRSELEAKLTDTDTGMRLSSGRVARG